MSDADKTFQLRPHDHVFLGRDHQQAERRTWGVIILCTIMMIAEIIGGVLFGSLALIADGLPHVARMPAPCCWPRWPIPMPANMPTTVRFSFGTGKFGDLAGYTSAIVLGDDRPADRL